MKRKKSQATPLVPQIPRRPTRDGHLHIRVERPKLERWRKSAELAGTDLTSWVEHYLDLAVPRATYNHARGDSPLTPCPACARMP